MSTNKNPLSIHDQTHDVTVIIPAAIAALPDLNLLEKAALAHISRYPACSNAGLSKLCGLSERGIESLIARLRKRGLVEMLGEGRARRHELTLPMEPSTNCGKAEVEESRKKCGSDECDESHAKCGKHAAGESPIACDIDTLASPGCKAEEPLAVFSERHFSLHDKCFEAELFDDARKHLELLRARVELDTEISVDQRTEWVRGITNQENRCFAFQTLKNAESNNELSEDQLRATAALVCKADPAQLALFRQQVEAGALPGKAIKLLA